MQDFIHTEIQILWFELEYLIQKGVRSGIELGTGKVLSGLIKKIDPEFQIYNINNLEDLKALEQLK